MKENLSASRKFVSQNKPPLLSSLSQTVGPLLAKPSKPLSPEIESLLKTGTAGSLYASFGSAFVLDKKEEVATFANALSSLGQKGYAVLWRITHDELPTNVTLESLHLDPSVHPITWVNQNDLLGSPRLSAFITHGGTNGVYESAYHGKPMINIPFANDHMDHAAKAEYRGYGITVARSTLTNGDPLPLVNAVEKLVNDPMYRQNAEKVGKMLRGYGISPAERAANWVEYALEMPRDGSGDLRGISGQLSWVALHSIDVMAAWIVVVLVLLGLVLGGLVIGWKGMRAALRVGGAFVHAAKNKRE